MNSNILVYLLHFFSKKGMSSLSMASTQNKLYKPNISQVIGWMNKPSGLQKIYLFSSPFPKTFFESQSWMKQADKSDTETPGISKKCPHKKLSPRYSAHNTTVKLNWIKSRPSND